jgi:hypothetical protein
MDKRFYFLIFFLSAFVSCEKKQEQISIVEQGLKSLADLGTVEYIVSKIVKADDNNTWYKFGDRKILFSCKASLKAGIDLRELSKDSIHINLRTKSVSLVLPKVRLLSFNMKPDDIRLVYEKTAFTRFSFSNAERDMIMAQGEYDIKNSIIELGILTDAEKNAKLFIETFLSQAGFVDIDVRFAKNYVP